MKLESIVHSETPLRKKKVLSKSFLAVKIIMFIIFLIYAVSLIYPIIFAFLSSLKDPLEYGSNPSSLPQYWLFSNYVDAFTELSSNGFGVVTMFWNSLWYTVGGTLLGVFVSSMTAYVVVKYDFPGKKIAYGISVFVMMIPIVGAMPSQYRMYTALGIIDTPFLVLSFAAGFGFNFVVMFSFFQSLSWEYAEAAFIDGASDFRVFLQIMLPQSLSMIVALCVVASVGFWNDYMGPLLFLKSYPTLAAGLYLYQLDAVMYQTMPVYFAALLMSAIPVVVFYIAFQNTLMDMTIGCGLKG